jgi:hypothetical protein
MRNGGDDRSNYRYVQLTFLLAEPPPCIQLVPGQSTRRALFLPFALCVPDWQIQKCVKYTAALSLFDEQASCALVSDLAAEAPSGCCREGAMILIQDF